MREYIICSSNRLEHEVRNVGIQRTDKFVQNIEQIMLSSRKNVKGEEWCN